METAKINRKVAIPTIGEISKPNVSPAAAPRMRSHCPCSETRLVEESPRPVNVSYRPVARLAGSRGMSLCTGRTEAVDVVARIVRAR